MEYVELTLTYTDRSVCIQGNNQNGMWLRILRHHWGDTWSNRFPHEMAMYTVRLKQSWSEYYSLVKFREFKKNIWDEVPRLFTIYCHGKWASRHVPAFISSIVANSSHSRTEIATRCSPLPCRSANYKDSYRPGCYTTKWSIFTSDMEYSSRLFHIFYLPSNWSTLWE